MKKYAAERKITMSRQAEEMALKDTVTGLAILVPIIAFLQVILILTWVFDMTGDRTASWGNSLYLSGYIYMLLASIGMGMLLGKCHRDIPANREKIFHIQMTYAWMLPSWAAILTLIDAVNGSDTYNTQFYVVANLAVMGICYMPLRKWTLIQGTTGLMVLVSAFITTQVDRFTFVTELMAYIAISIIAGRYMLLMKMNNYERQAKLTEMLEGLEYDPLTGVYTREAFYRKAAEFLEQNPDTAYTLIVSDIDNFKQINSICGNEMGNELLCYLAGQYRKYSKLTGRYGSDQFIAIFPTSEKLSAQGLDTLVRTIAEGAPVRNLSVRYGYCDIGAEEVPMSVLCDRALAAAKSIGRDYTHRIACYDGPVSRKQLQADKNAADFPEAIAQKEFVMWYQPKVDPYTGRTVGAEALVRWGKPDGQIILPSGFLDGFEENGQIVELDEYVFRAVCRHQKEWMAAGREALPISVNLSRKSLARPDLVQVYRSIVEESGIPIDTVPIEITESAAVRSVLIQPVVQELSNSGFTIHMDDFGSGQSSINGLNVLPVDIVKIDKSLVDNIGQEGGNTILKGLMGILKELGLHMVAEGVETKEQLDFLMANQVDEIQGYYYAKPLPEDSFEAFIRAEKESI